MKSLKKVATDAEMVAQEYTVVYYSTESGKVGVKKNDTPPTPPSSPLTKVWYKDGSYKEFDIEGALIGNYENHGNNEDPLYGTKIWTPTTLINDAEKAIKVELGNKITSISMCPFVSGKTRFNNGTKVCELTEIIIPDSVTSIGDYAFSDCSSLTSINIPDSVTSIGDNAFYNCSGLTSINIPDSVTSIGDFALYGCTSLPVVDNFCYVDTYLVRTVDKTIESANIKDGTKWIGEYAFSGCSSLTSINIPDSVTSIGVEAFYGCI